VVALVLSAVLALASHGAAARSHAVSFPTRGVVVPGKSIGGIALGMTGDDVKDRWGSNYTVCGKSCGSVTTWFFEYHGGEPLGAAVKLSSAGRVVAVFTLGSPAGWGIKGVMIGDAVSNVYALYNNTGTANCIGYDALTVTIGDTVTSFYSSSGVIYGYALTAPSQSPCQ
jgi:hypothetical protein